MSKAKVFYRIEENMASLNGDGPALPDDLGHRIILLSRMPRPSGDRIWLSYRLPVTGFTTVTWFPNVNEQVPSKWKKTRDLESGSQSASQSGEPQVQGQLGDGKQLQSSKVVSKFYIDFKSIHLDERIKKLTIRSRFIYFMRI